MSKSILKQITFLLSVMALLAVVVDVKAQTRPISGVVTSKHDNSTLPGVNVIIKGSGVGTTTDANGRYKLDVPGSAKTLVFSYIGFNSSEINIGSETVINEKLTESASQLSEVVVTALGFREEKDKLAATSSKIEGKSIVNSGETGLINGLAGKASGVQINRSSGDPGAGSFILIRGLSTLTGDNQPLIIIDGIPVSNSYVGGSSGGALQQSRLNDINPNDIASVQVLKGASAAALWGSRAANGVIIITTKNGSKDRLNISVSSTLSIDNPNVAYHARQKAFGQGSGGKYDPSATNSWGDKIADRSGGEDLVKTDGAYFQSDITGKKYYPIIQKNSRDVFVDSNYDQVFRTGHSLDNAISISGGNDKSTFYFSAGDLSQKGIVRNNSDYQRSTFKLNVERKFNQVFNIQLNSTYTKTSSNRIGRSNSTSAAPAGLLRNPADFDVTDYKGSYFSSPTASPELARERTYRSYLGALANPFIGNPLWAINEQKYKSSINRFVNSAQIGIKPVSWFDLTARAGYDFYLDERFNYFPKNDYQGAGLGSFTESLLKESEWTTDVIGRATKNFGRNFNVVYIAGFSVNNRKYYNNSTTVTNFIIADAPPSFSNATAANRSASNQSTNIRNARVYNTASLSLWNALFANVSVAGEAGSAFGEKSKKTFYYPSADLAWQFSQLNIFQNSSVLSFGKLRASFGVVGIQPLPYRTQTSFVSANYSQGELGDNINGGQYGNGAFIQSSEQGNNQLRPERKTEYEIGADLRFFDNRLRAGLTYYQNTVKDMLIPVTLPVTTGFVTKYANAASLENKGAEVDLSLDVIRSQNFKWALNANFSRNRNRVTDIAGTNAIPLTPANVTIIGTAAVVGHSVGSFWAGKYERKSDGALALDENGFPKLDAKIGIIGDPNPKWGGGFGTTLSYKKLSLDVLFETSQGGDFYAGTEGVMGNFGTHENVGKEVKLTKDTKNYAGKTFAAGSTVRGNLKDFGAGEVLLDEPYYTSIGGGFSNLKEHLIQDGSWTRLRQVSLGYSLDKSVFGSKFPFQSIDINVSGRNLLLWTKIKGIDPDTNLSGTLLARNTDHFNTPNTRSFVFTLRLNY